jgi:hypothetical protein
LRSSLHRFSRPSIPQIAALDRADARPILGVTLFSFFCFRVGRSRSVSVISSRSSCIMMMSENSSRIAGPRAASHVRHRPARSAR